MTKRQVIEKLRHEGMSNVSYSGKERKFFATDKMGVRRVYSKEGNLVQYDFKKAK